jgi:pyruvate dehydrogenase E1 component alpha subunit
MAIKKRMLLEFYRQMLMIRLVELRIEELYPQDEMKTPVHLCIGQEAIAVGVCAGLKKDDYCFSTHRGHGHYLAKGGDLKAMIAELYGKTTGCSRGRGGSMHLIDTAEGFVGTSSIIAGSIPIATGAGLSAKMKKDGRVSVAFFGDAGLEQGAFYESVNFAALKKLPVVYICENNFYSVCTHLKKRQPDDKLYKRASGFSVPGYQVDGNNVLEVYRAAKKAIEAARAGKGPSLVECRTYRCRGHAGAGSDVSAGYRSQCELDEWTARCPLINYEKYLLKKGLLTERTKGAMESAINRKIDEAFKSAKSGPSPEASEISRYLYAPEDK